MSNVVLWPKFQGFSPFYSNISSTKDMIKFLKAYSCRAPLVDIFEKKNFKTGQVISKFVNADFQKIWLNYANLHKLL